MRTHKGERTRIVSVGSSSKNAGKSTLASHLVRELEADYGLKVSSGGRHAPARPVTTDRRIIAQPGTDTGALVEAGAKKVLWVNAEGNRLARELKRVLTKLSGGLLVTEGNSVLEHLDPDFSVFLMAAPFEEFKPSALLALPEVDLVLVDRRGKLGDKGSGELEQEIRNHATDARLIFYGDESERHLAWEQAVRMIRSRLAE